MRMSSIIIGILLVGGMITGLYSFANGMASDQDGYAVTYDASYESAFDKSNNVSEKIMDDYQEIQNFTTNKASAIGIITLVPDVLSLLKNTITLPLTLLEGMVQSVINYMHLPDWTYVLFMTTFSIIVIFAFVALVLRFRHV